MAASKPPHRHHYVPRMVQRNFANEDGGLYFWRRGFAIGEVRSSTPTNLFIEDDLYSITDRDGARDTSVELWFSRLESTAAKFIGQLLNIVRQGMTPILDESSWELWHHYNYFAQKRSVAWHSRFLTEEDMLKVIKRIASEEQWAEHQRMWGEDPAKAARVMNNSRVAAQVDPPPADLLADLRSRGLTVYVAPSQASFILGDDVGSSASIRALDGGASGQLVHFMPIASDVAIGYSAVTGTVHVDYLTISDVHRMNEATAKRSYLIAGRSRAVIASLSATPYDPPRMLEEWLRGQPSIN